MPGHRARPFLILAVCAALLCGGAAVIAGDVASAGDGVSTPFDKARRIAVPPDREGFTFAVLGDRTGGPASGIAVLEQAVVELNRLDPDLVMNVGDMINGYNKEREWLSQMKVFRRTMSKLKMPWYPVAGNHDVYSPGANPRNRANEKLYQKHFGPLYYSFDYRNTHFIVIYSDESLSYRNPPVDQQMSAEQLEWLQKDLADTKARHVFAFLHHPRWNYKGNPWEPVHKVMAASGKVSAVFAGHWHRYRYDGERDGIRYYCMAATGAYIDDLAGAGAIHHYNLVSVRDDGWSMTCIPVGAVLDPEWVSGQESADVWSIRDGQFIRIEKPFPAPVLRDTRAPVEVILSNTTTRPLDISVRWLGLPETGWRIGRTEAQATVPPGEEQVLTFRLGGTVPPEGEALPPLCLEAEAVYTLAKGSRQEIRTLRNLPYDVPPMPEALTRDDPKPKRDRVLALDGKDDCVVIDNADDLHIDGPFTLECWARLETPGERAALLAKTEGSAYGIFLSDGNHRGPTFHVFIDGKGYASARALERYLYAGKWTHFAGVFDGKTARIYVNGNPLGEVEMEGPVKGNGLPIIVGADVNRHGRPVSFTGGLVDEVRLSRGALYDKPFIPGKRLQPDGDTVLMLHFDTVFGVDTPDTSGNGHHGRITGGARLVEVD